MQKVNKKVKERTNEITRRHIQTGPQKIFQTDSRFGEDYSTTLVLMLAICPVPFMGKLGDAFRRPVLFYLSWYRGFILQDRSRKTGLLVYKKIKPQIHILFIANTQNTEQEYEYEKKISP